MSIREIERRQGKFPFLSFYVHRLLRLSSTYYFSIFIYFKLLPHIGSGPLWSFAVSIRQCKKYWNIEHGRAVLIVRLHY